MGAGAWKHRQPSRTARWIWGVAIVIGWVAVFAAVDLWASNNGHADWTEGRRSQAALMAGVAYWPAAMAIWRLIFPGDKSWVPWQHWNSRTRDD